MKQKNSVRPSLFPNLLLHSHGSRPPATYSTSRRSLCHRRGAKSTVPREWTRDAKGTRGVEKKKQKAPRGWQKSNHALETNIIHLFFFLPHDYVPEVQYLYLRSRLSQARATTIKDYCRHRTSSRGSKRGKNGEGRLLAGG